MSKLLQAFQDIPYFLESMNQRDHQLSFKIVQKFKKTQIFGSNANIQCNGDSLVSVIIYQPFFANLRDLIIVFKIDLRKRTMKIRAFFGKNLVITFTGSRNFSLAFLGRSITKINLSYNHKNPILVIEKGLGQISIICYRIFTSAFLESNQFIDFLKQKINFIACQAKLRTNILMQSLNLLPPCYDKINLRKDLKKEMQKQSLFCNISKYISMSIIPNIDKKISVQDVNVTQRPEYNIIQNLTKSEHSWKIQKSYKWFGYIHQAFMIPKSYDISSQEQKKFESIFQKPSGISKKVGQNKFIFNYIKIPDEVIKQLQLNNAKNHIVRKGGFCNVFVLQSLKFHYIQTVQAIAEDQRNLHESNLWRAPQGQLQKHICVKMPNQNKNSELRIDHQIQIVKRLKSASTSYLFKYYMTTQKDFEYRGKLFFDFIGDLTLFDFLNSREQTLSIQFKIIIVINIAQALRFLDQYHIAHLDLKPANVFIFKDFRIKIFDFSESYHKAVCKRGYRPGYTLPYSCPEVFSQKNRYEYTIRNDIYSLGILMFRLFFRKQPMNFQKIIKYYEAKTYFSHFYLSVQALECYGNQKVLNILTNLILKCLHPDVQKRPFPTWVIITLTQILKLLQ